MNARRLPILLLTPAIAMLALLFITPLFWFFIDVFSREKSVSDLAERFVEVLTSRPVMTALITTNWICLLVTALALVIGYPIAYYMANRTGWRFALVLFCIIVPYFTSVIVRTYSWMVLLGRNGIINQALQSTGLIDAPIPLLYNKLGILIGMTYVLLPYMILTLYAAMRGIDPSLTRAAFGLGASRLYTFWRDLLPAQPAWRDLRLADRLHPGYRIFPYPGADGRTGRRDDRHADRTLGRDHAGLDDGRDHVDRAAGRHSRPLRRLLPVDRRAPDDGGLRWRPGKASRYRSTSASPASS